MDLPAIVQKAYHSKLNLFLLNWFLGRIVPFNRPHGIRIVEIKKEFVKTRIPYIRRNFNHIKGLHACVLATLSEFTTGFLLLSRLDNKRYRIIMKKLEMNYHFQGKMDAYAEFSIQEAWLEKNIYTPLKERESVEIPCEVHVFDQQGNHLTTGWIHWQIKAWSKVKTRVE